MDPLINLRYACAAAALLANAALGTTSGMITSARAADPYRRCRGGGVLSATILRTPLRAAVYPSCP